MVHNTEVLSYQLARLALSSSRQRLIQRTVVGEARSFSSSNKSKDVNNSGSSRSATAFDMRSRMSSAQRLEIVSKTGGNGRNGVAGQGSRRAFATSSPRESFLASIRDRVAKVALGSNYAAVVKRGGQLPEEQEKMDYAKRRDAAYAAFSPDGTPLFENPDEELPALKAQEEKAQRVSSKREARQMRKRWGAPGKEEHKYSTALFKISPRKLKLLADQIGGQPIDHAILQMQFSAKRAAKRIKSTLALARDHAAAKGLDPRSLIVSEAWIGKGKYITRADLKGRARVGRKHHPFARMSIVLRPGKTWQQKELEKLEKARKRMRSIGDGGVVRTNKKIVNMFQRPGWAW